MFNIDGSENPIKLAQEWLQEARKTEINDPNAMALSTASSDGIPDVRMVLCKDISDEGFQFFTNLNSAKGQQLKNNANVALCFHWKSLERQIRVRGSVKQVSDDIADAYFNTRHPQSRRGAIASLQSQPLDSRQSLIDAVEAVKKEYPDDHNIPRPEHWSGFNVAPHEIEFWQAGDNRLHDRFLFKKIDNRWVMNRLYP